MIELADLWFWAPNQPISVGEGQVPYWLQALIRFTLWAEPRRANWTPEPSCHVKTKSHDKNQTGSVGSGWVSRQKMAIEMTSCTAAVSPNTFTSRKKAEAAKSVAQLRYPLVSSEKNWPRCASQEDAAHQNPHCNAVNWDCVQCGPSICTIRTEPQDVDVWT